MTEEDKVVENANLDTLKERLMTVTNEIDAIKHSFTKSTEDLSRIQNMLSVGKLDDLSGIMQKYESKVAEVEKEKM